MIRARAVPGPLPEPGYMRTCSFELACLGLYVAETVVAPADPEPCTAKSNLQVEAVFPQKDR